MPAASSPTLTDVAAWWGAVLATFVLGWDVYKWFHRTHLRVTVRPNMLVLGETPPRFHVTVEVVNDGEQPVTLTHVLGEHCESTWQRVRRKPKASFFVRTVDAPELPHLLEPGARWISSFPQDGLLKYGRGTLHVGIGHAAANRPILRRLDPLKPDTEAKE
jgi:hypothetical protein